MVEFVGFVVVVGSLDVFVDLVFVVSDSAIVVVVVVSVVVVSVVVVSVVVDSVVVVVGSLAVDDLSEAGVVVETVVVSA